MSPFPTSEVLNGVLYFPTDNGVNGVELWRSDGTTAGTMLVKDINPGAGSSHPVTLTAYNGALYFAANNGTSGIEVWKSDGTAAGTVLLKDIWAGASSGLSQYGAEFTESNGLLFFEANNGALGVELWRTDGTTAGTVLVKDVNPGVNNSLFAGGLDFFTNVNGMVFFSAVDATSGRELWKSDGSNAGTVMVRDIVAGASSSNPSSFMSLNGILVFQASSGLWRSDGTTAGTWFIKAISIFGFGRLVVGNIAYVSGTDMATGTELWKTDGTTAGTVLVKEIMPGSGGSNIYGFTAVNGIVLFNATDPVNGGELWKTDGTAAGTVLVKDINPGNVGPIGSSVKYNVNGTVYFAATNAISGSELWRSDGTALGTVRVADIAPGVASSAPYLLGVVGGSVLFAATDGGTAGRELWKTVRTESDFDGEGKADVVVYRPSAGQWWIKRSFGNFASSIMVPWGVSTDVPAPADFDNAKWISRLSGRRTVSVRARSITGYRQIRHQLGHDRRRAVPAHDSIAGSRRCSSVHRAMVQINRSSTGYTTANDQWGDGRRAGPADYTGDGRTDIVLSASMGVVLKRPTPSCLVTVVQWASGRHLAADYDGDAGDPPSIVRPWAIGS